MILTKDQIINYLTMLYDYETVLINDRYFINKSLVNDLYVGVVIPVNKTLKNILAVLCKQNYLNIQLNNDVILITTIKSYYRNDICQKILN